MFYQFYRFCDFVVYQSHSFCFQWARHHYFLFLEKEHFNIYNSLLLVVNLMAKCVIIDLSIFEHSKFDSPVKYLCLLESSVNFFLNFMSNYIVVFQAYRTFLCDTQKCLVAEV